jgi:hypothetical protein
MAIDDHLAARNEEGGKLMKLSVEFLAKSPNIDHASWELFLESLMKVLSRDRQFLKEQFRLQNEKFRESAAMLNEINKEPEVLIKD